MTYTHIKVRNPTWFRVVGAGGLSGAAKRTPEEAWRSFDRVAMRRGWREDQLGSAAAAASAQLVAGTTRRAVQEADVSRVCGEVGRGAWSMFWEDDQPAPPPAPAPEPVEICPGVTLIRAAPTRAEMRVHGIRKILTRDDCLDACYQLSDPDLGEVYRKIARAAGWID